ncbi:MAG: tetratricopeptide repeat protein, partial [Acidobacteria bacterium]|nr:tetratricopeptide repeat protein [Acidobacteriota bacterium]
MMRGRVQASAALVLATFFSGWAAAADSALDHFRRGQLLLTQKHPGEAISEFRAALALDPSLTDARAGVIRALLAQNEFQKAVSEAEESRRQAPNRTDLLSLEALAYYRMGNYPKADRLYSRVVEQNPGDADAWYHRGRILLSRLGDQGALGLLETATSIQPNNALYQHYRGVALRRLGRLSEAASAFAIAARLAPDQAGPVFYLGWVALDRGEYAEAEKNFREAIRLNPSFAQAHFRLGMVLLNQKNLPAAQASLQKSIELFPNFDLAWYNLGKCYVLQGQETKAAEAFHRFRQLEPVSDSISKLRQTLARSPGDLQAQRKLGELLARTEGTFMGS